MGKVIRMLSVALATSWPSLREDLSAWALQNDGNVIAWGPYRYFPNQFALSN
jgi:hypothetical protein